MNPYFGIPAIPSDPFDGSALIVWDSGAAHAADHQHRADRSAPTRTPTRATRLLGRHQKSDFLKTTGGTIVDVCAGLPCVAP